MAKSKQSKRDMELLSKTAGDNSMRGNQESPPLVRPENLYRASRRKAKR